MKKFVLITKSESSDEYTYFIKHSKKPNTKELELFLKEHACDKDEDEVYENVVSIEEIEEDNFLTIPKNNMEKQDFWVECNVCKTQLKNWTGSTPCCGSIAYMIENGKPTKKLSLFTSINDGPIKPTIIDL